MNDSPTLISERSDPAIQRIADISKPQFKPGAVMFLEDEIPIREAILGGARLVEVYADEAHVPTALVELCKDRRIPFRAIASSLVSQIFKARRRPDVMAVAHTPQRHQLGDINLRDGDVVVLDGVRIVGNIGAIVRSAFALGASGVVLCGSELESVMDRRLVRASRGYVFSLPVVLATESELISWAEQNHCRLIGMTAGGQVRIDELMGRDEPMGLVFGSELRGLSHEMAQAISLTASIPMMPGAESLNVSVAAGIVMFLRGLER
ncbi:NshR/TsnR family 23S rRNA methyltransferase [Actinomyces bowdenii]|uniref:RNA methyltransferase n=1 Tax=Actinomyces bowdenii TaxID=131109 RepID=A0A3P1V441_9ACTO|nr:TrmH family RNA methyltransferase [Actinomyces bowdenii]MBO3724968.1 NshR/TsnR family 23S rRNA methyltransferase [Actinomyces bowdenii]RRD28959.1 RNA methyltransferase [Actinomyces bowdenii]